MRPVPEPPFGVVYRCRPASDTGMSNDDSDKARARLEQVAEFRRQGAFGRARLALRALGRTRMAATLGSKTTLGLPRALHAAHLDLAEIEADPMARIAWRYHMVPPADVLAPFTALSAFGKARAVALSRTPVPPVLHQIWVGPAPVPGSTAAWAFLARRRGFRYRLWRERDLARLGIDRAPAFRTMMERRDWCGAADIAQYHILAREGGVCMDCDWYPARDDTGLADALPMVGLSALADDTPRAVATGSPFLDASLIAAPADHPVMHHLNAVLPDVIDTLPDAPAWWVTGSLIFTLVARCSPVSVAPHGTVAGTLPSGAPPDAVAALRADAMARADGFMIRWKSCAT